MLSSLSLVLPSPSPRLPRLHLCLKFNWSKFNILILKAFTHIACNIPKEPIMEIHFYTLGSVTCSALKMLPLIPEINVSPQSLLVNYTGKKSFNCKINIIIKYLSSLKYYSLVVANPHLLTENWSGISLQHEEVWSLFLPIDKHKLRLIRIQLILIYEFNSIRNLCVCVCVWTSV